MQKRKQFLARYLRMSVRSAQLTNPYTAKHYLILQPQKFLTTKQYTYIVFFIIFHRIKKNTILILIKIDL